MKLNVLLYKDTANPNGYPGTWPAKCREVKDTAAAPTAPWVEMTLDQFRAATSNGNSAAATAISAQIISNQMAAAVSADQAQKITDFKSLQAAAAAKVG